MLGSFLSKYLVNQILEEKTPTVHVKKCTNLRQRKTVCDRCVKVCECGALSYDKGLKFNKDNCNNCGRCVAVCPSVVFVPRMEAVKRYHDIIQRKDTLRLGCSFSEGVSDFPVSCLCELPLDLLCYAAIDKTLQIDVSKCADCKHQTEKEIVKELLSGLRTFLGEEMYQKSVITGILSDEEEKATRREFLSFLGNGGKQAAQIAAPFLFPKNEEARICRMLLVSKIKATKNPENYHMPSVGVTKACYGCKICEKLCPQEAITIVNEDNKRYFVHNHMKCTHCGICQTVCTENAISYFMEPANVKTSRTVYEIQSGSCRLCNTPIPETKDGLCVVCHRKERRNW